MAEPNGISTSKFIFEVFKWVAPIILTLLAGWYSVTFSMGAKEQRLINAETRITELQTQVNYFRDNYAPRTELKPQLDSILRTLDRIEENQVAWYAHSFKPSK